MVLGLGMPPSPAPEFGPITARQAQSRRIRYGCLTPAQFDDLDRVLESGIASMADMMGPRPFRRVEQSVVRAMGRYVTEGWVESVGIESWRLSVRGRHVLSVAYEHMDTMCEDEGEL